MFFIFGYAAWEEGFTTLTRVLVLCGRQFLTVKYYPEDEDDERPRFLIRDIQELSVVIIQLMLDAAVYCTCEIAIAACNLTFWIYTSILKTPRMVVSILRWIWYGTQKLSEETYEMIKDVSGILKKFSSLIIELPKLLINCFIGIGIGFVFSPAVMAIWIWRFMCSLLWAASNLPQITLNRIRSGYGALYTWLSQLKGPENQDILVNPIEQPAINLDEVKSSFLEACKNNNKANMRKLLREHGELIDVNMTREQTGDTALHLAVKGGHIAIVESLLSVKENIVDVNIVNSDSETPLLIASANGHVGIVKRLLRVKGIKLKDGSGERTVMKAIENDNFDVAQLIMEAIENRGITTKLLKPKGLLTSCLNRYVKLANELASGAGRSKSEHDMRRLSKRLETYKKSILSIVSPKKPEALPDRKKSLRESCDELRECLECTICYENFEDMKVFACSEDHWICSLCLSRIDKCPSCRQDFNAHPPTRRVTCEKILSMVKDHISLFDE